MATSSFDYGLNNNYYDYVSFIESWLLGVINFILSTLFI